MKFTKRILSVSILSAALAVGAHAGDAMDDQKQALNDAWLDGKSEPTLLMRQHLNNFTIDTLVNDGVVTLRGDVESEVDKHLAEAIAKNTSDVEKVFNRLQINR